MNSHSQLIEITRKLKRACGYCSRHFRREEHLQRHLRTRQHPRLQMKINAYPYPDRYQREAIQMPL